MGVLSKVSRFLSPLQYSSMERKRKFLILWEPRAMHQYRFQDSFVVSIRGSAP